MFKTLTGKCLKLRTLRIVHTGRKFFDNYIKSVNYTGYFSLLCFSLLKMLLSGEYIEPCFQNDLLIQCYREYKL